MEEKGNEIHLYKKKKHTGVFLEEIIASPVFATLEEKNDKSTYRQRQADRQAWSDSRNLISAKKKKAATMLCQTVGNHRCKSHPISLMASSCCSRKRPPLRLHSPNTRGNLPSPRYKLHLGPQKGRTSDIRDRMGQETH